MIRFLFYVATVAVCTSAASAQTAAHPSPVGDRRWAPSAELRVLTGGGGARDTLELRATLENRTDDPQSIEYAACPLRLYAYRPAGSEEVPVWRSEHRYPWNEEHEYACPVHLTQEEVSAGEALSPGAFVLRVPLAEMLADSLPDGVYRFVAELDAGSLTFRIPVGEAELRMEREPLSQKRVVGTLTATATTLVNRTEPSVVRTEVTLRGARAREVGLRFPSDCPIVLYAYRSRERRDAAPLAGPPDRSEPRQCGEQMREVTLERGGEITFALELYARDLLGSSLPAGTYYFAVGVQLEGRHIYLSAGESELRR